MGHRAFGLLDSYASLLILLLANFFLLEIVDDPRWGVTASTEDEAVTAIEMRTKRAMVWCQPGPIAVVPR